MNATDTVPGDRQPVIVRAVQTCQACPSQWNAWDDKGRYWYLRYRFGTAELQPGPDPGTWELKPPELGFSHGHPLDGVISLEEFARLAGLALKLGTPGIPD